MPALDGVLNMAAERSGKSPLGPKGLLRKTGLYSSGRQEKVGGETTMTTHTATRTTSGKAEVGGAGVLIEKQDP